jgi:hypothetical protein
MKHYTVDGKDYYILEQGPDFNDYRVIGTTASACSNSDDHTLIDTPIPVLMNVDDGLYETSNGQTLYGRTIFNKNDDSETQIKVKEVWEADYGPEWEQRFRSTEDNGSIAGKPARLLREAWFSNFGETMETEWSKLLVQLLYFQATPTTDNSLLLAVRRAGRFQLMYSADMNDPLNKGPLMFKSRGFAIQAMKQLLGITRKLNGSVGRFDYYFKSFINLKGHLVTTKDGNNRIVVEYRTKDGRKGGNRDWTQLCGNAFLFINKGDSTGEQVLPSFQADLGEDVTQAGDETYVVQDLFDLTSTTPPPEFLTWWDRLCDYYDGLQAQYEEDIENAFQPPEDYESNGIRFGMFEVKVDVNGPGALFLGGRFAFGKNNNTGSLWLGNLHFFAGVNPRNLASQVWGQMRSRQQNYRPIVQQKAQNRISNAASGSTGTSDLNLNGSQTTTANSTRPSNTDAVAESNAASGTQNGESDTRNSENQGPVDTSQ